MNFFAENMLAGKIQYVIILALVDVLLSYQRNQQVVQVIIEQLKSEKDINGQLDQSLE